MAAKRSRRSFTDEQKRSILQEVADSGTSIAKVLRKHNVGESTFYNWKKSNKFKGATKARSPRGSISKRAKSTSGTANATKRISSLSTRSQDHIGPMLQNLRSLQGTLTRELERVSKAIEALEG